MLPVLQGVAKQIGSAVQKKKSAINIQADDATNATAMRLIHLLVLSRLNF
jgi:hypothetical protein